ncbi:MAG: glutaredoxin domain-containing protein [Myxococcota bacterium]
MIGLLMVAGCEDEKPPAPPPSVAKASPGQADAAPAAEAFFDASAAAVVLTFAGDRGQFADTSKVDTIPEEAKGLVRVKLLEGEAAPPGTVWVTNLRTPESDGRFRLRPVVREMFEELALGQGRRSDVTLPEGLEPPTKVAPAEGVIVYKTAWCGVCKKVEGYLERKGVSYEAKDIEKDRQAAAELTAKAQAQGVKTGSVPVIDVGGQLIVGFDRGRLEKLL